MITDNIEETLNGGYNGLYGEVVTEDCYKLKQLKFTPDIILDLGGNIGVFARFARTLFPEAEIISVEPHAENCEVYKKFTHDSKIHLMNRAVGIGQIYHNLGACNGSGEVYLSAGLGYPEKALKDEANIKIEPSSLESVMPDELINTWVLPGMKSLIKIDIEGSENFIFDHKPSMDALKTIDYICMELHWYAMNANLVEEVRNKSLKALKSLEETHDCVLDHVHFWATKKETTK